MSPCGGISRHAGLRSQCFGVQVQVLPRVPSLTTGSRSVNSSGPALDAGAKALQVRVLPSRPCATSEMAITLVRLTRIRGSNPWLRTNFEETKLRGEMNITLRYERRVEGLNPSGATRFNSGL